MNAEDIFRSSIGCEIMFMIKARIRLIFSRYTRNGAHNHLYLISKANVMQVSMSDYFHGSDGSVLKEQAIRVRLATKENHPSNTSYKYMK